MHSVSIITFSICSLVVLHKSDGPGLKEVNSSIFAALINDQFSDQKNGKSYMNLCSK
jgi:hypothetical protein